jgi:diaminopropionate ammonia-lyase
MDTLPVEIFINPQARHDVAYGERLSKVLSLDGLARAKSVISQWPDYLPTPLVELPGMAKAANVASIHYKDEAHRFGLKSFKPLGGAYAVACLLMKVISSQTGDEFIEVRDLLDGKYAGECSTVTVTAATDGNHGRSVAWGARMFGCRCVIFINEAVSAGREKAIANFGAEVRRNPGSFDDAVRTASITAREEGWHVIPDTSDGEIVEAPRNVTQGYALMADEVINQLPYGIPSHIFLQAGVGGMAAATCSRFWQEYGSKRPLTVLVEPFSSACWFESLQAGKPVAVSGDLESLMGGLSCGEVSRVAWPILETGADAAMKISDEAAAQTMRFLAHGEFGDLPLVAGESGVAGLAGFLAAMAGPDSRQQLGIDENSRIVVFGTEGATDPQTYTEIVGKRPEEVTR